jgi:N-acetyl-anhydromuramyl-L-alanine amidase AmpD
MIKLLTSNYSPWKNSKEYCILHHTWNTHLQWNINVLIWKTRIKASCHYLVDHQWQVYNFWSEDLIMWHCWLSSWNWKRDLNRFSIWIEVLGPWFTEEQKKAVDELIIDIYEKNNIPKENILRHKDIAPWRKVDIADSFWNDKFNSYEAYINSLFTKKKIMGFYEKIFIQENKKGSTIFNDLDWALNRCIKEDWSLDSKEFFYLVMIWLERLWKK